MQAELDVDSAPKKALGCVHTAMPFHGANPCLACPTQAESRKQSYFGVEFSRAILWQNPSCGPTLRGNAYRADMLPIFCSGFVVENPQLLQ